MKFPKLFGKKKSDDDDDDFEDEDVDVVDLDEHFDPADEIMEDNTDADAQGDADDAHADLEDEMVVGGELESDEIEFHNDDDFEDEDVDVVDLDEHFDPVDEIMEDDTDADAQGGADDAHADLEDEMVVGGELESDEIEFDNDDDDEEDESRRR